MKEIHDNNSILDNNTTETKQYSDKYVYENINRVLKEITYEKKINLGQTDLIHFVELEE